MMKHRRPRAELETSQKCEIKRKKYDGLGPSEARRLEQLKEKQQARALGGGSVSADKAMLQDVLRRMV